MQCVRGAIQVLLANFVGVKKKNVAYLVLVLFNQLSRYSDLQAFG